MREAPRLPGHPVVGNLLQARSEFLDFFEAAARCGDIVRREFVNIPAYLIVQPGHIKHVFVDNYKNYGKQTHGYNVLRISLGNGLVTSDCDFWRRQRRIAQPSFHRKSIDRFSEIMKDCTVQMLGRWRAGEVLEVEEEMMKVTLQIVGKCLLSLDLSDDSDMVGRALEAMLEDTVHRIPRLLSPPLWVPTARNRRRKGALAEFDQALKTMPHPMLAYCRSGTRCTMLWAFTQHGRMDDADIIERAAKAGYDVSGLIGQMSQKDPHAR